MTNNLETETTTPEEFTISEVTEIYKTLNNNLCEAFKIFKNLYENKVLNESDLIELTRLDMDFRIVTVNSEELAMHSDTIYRSVIETIFSDLMHEANLLYKSYNSDYWELVQEDGIRLIIRNGYEVSKFLELYHKFYHSMVRINYEGEFYLLSSDDLVDDFEFDSNLEYLDISEILQISERINDVNEKIEFLNQVAIEMEFSLLKLSSNSIYRDKLQDYLSKCRQAIDIISKNLLTAENINLPDIKEDTAKHTDKETDTINSKNPEFTTSRQVLAVYYLLNTIDRGSFNQTDRTVKARFIEFLTGKNFDNIYDALSDPFKGLENKNNKRILKDLDYIKSHFSRLGLQSIIDQINNDIK